MSDTSVIVCSECLRASCWQGLFYCEKYKYADTVIMDIDTLKDLNLESPSYWERPERENNRDE